MAEAAQSRSGFAHFWPYYLRAHMDPRTRAAHYTGTILGVILFLIGVINGPWWLILLGFVVGYGLAVPTHPIFEGNRPASMINPHWSFVGDFYMLGLFLTGRLGKEIERVKNLPDLAGKGIKPQ
jgi:hypothetical protein